MRWRSDVFKRHLWHVRCLTCNNSMAYLKNWTDNFFQILFMGTSWVAVSINNITTRASREMTSRKNIKIFDFNMVNVAKHWHVAGEVFAISDCLVKKCTCTIVIEHSFRSITHNFIIFTPLWNNRCGHLGSHFTILYHRTSPKKSHFSLLKMNMQLLKNIFGKLRVHIETNLQ